MANNRLIGLSLSFCIKDIILGQVQLESVEKIVTGTKAVTEAHWEEIADRYTQVYWKADPAKAREVLNELRASGRIEQPRVDQKIPYNIATGHRVEATEGLLEKHPLTIAMPHRTEIV
jgi:phosphoglycolate phosphatase-like HAD superfamily hydrolase